MHEVSLVQSLLGSVEREAQRCGATAVHRVVVRLGAAGGVEPELFETAFTACRSGTICAAATLVLVREEARWICSVCSAPIPAGARLVCPSCGWPARLASGDALVLERLDLEVPSHV